LFLVPDGAELLLMLLMLELEGLNKPGFSSFCLCPVTKEKEILKNGSQQL